MPRCSFLSYSSNPIFSPFLLPILQLFLRAYDFVVSISGFFHSLDSLLSLTLLPLHLLDKEAGWVLFELLLETVLLEVCLILVVALSVSLPIDDGQYNEHDCLNSEKGCIDVLE